MREEQNIKKKKKNKTNREILAVTYVFLLAFVCLIGYFIYFMNVESESYITSPYNTRQDLLADRVKRGEILSSDGTVLAETVTDQSGNESRRYPYGSLFAHVLGYSTKGKSGIESAYNFYMLKSHINPFDRIMNELTDQKSPGDRVITTLDVELQRIAYDGMGGYDGAVVVMEPATGKILAMVSKPDFDPNQIEEIWDSLVSESETSNLLNRATAGLYPPASTFKIVTALEYYRQYGSTVLLDFAYECTGGYQLEEYSLACFNGHVHGGVNLRTAFAQSCNAAFIEIGLKLDLKRYYETAETLLFNQEMPFALSNRSGSYVLDSSATVWDVMQTSIGQGKTLVTPLQNALITAAVANDGIIMKPYVVDRIESVNKNQVKQYRADEYAQVMTKEEADVLTELMISVVEEGTAKQLQSDEYQAAGKTGTAEYQTGTDESHSWFVGFAPAEDPKIVVSIILEDAGKDSGVSKTMAKKLFDAYLK